MGADYVKSAPEAGFREVLPVSDCKGEQLMSKNRCRQGFLLIIALIIGVVAGRSIVCARESQKADIYFMPFSHLDFYWGGTREECVSRGNRIIAKAIKLAKEFPQFRFLLEDDVFVANFMDSHRGLPETEELKRLVREGRVEISPKWVGIFQGLPDGEVHARNMAIGKRYARDVFGVDAQVSHLGDLPGYTPQFPQILELSRVPYVVITRMGPSDKYAFNWTSPDGSKVLAWNSLKGYGWGTFLTSKTRPEEEKRERFLKDLVDVQKNWSGPILMHWGTDLWTAPDDLVPTVEKFFKSVPAKLNIATPSEFFHQLERSSAIPDVSGEIPSSWPNIVSSLVHVWPGIIPATNTLLAAEKFATVNYALGYADYPQQEFDFMWKKLVESMDHNHDGQGGRIGDNRKIEYEQLSIIRGGEILRDSLRNIAERVEIPIRDSFPIVVFNPLGWERDDVVRAHMTIYGNVGPYEIDDFRKGMKLLDETGKSVPFFVEQWSENISRALELVFVACGVPSLGYKTYYLVASEKPDVFTDAAKVGLDQEKDQREPRRELGSDVLENSFYRLSIDLATGRVTLFDKALKRDVCRDMEVVALEERGGNYIGKEPPSGRTIVSMVDNVELLENNAVRAVIEIKSRIADIPITQRLTLYQGLKQLDIENTVEWRSVRPRFVRIRQLFPTASPDAVLNYGIPFGVNSADNLMPNAETIRVDEITNESWRRSRHIHDWICADSPDGGLTIAADHQQIRLEGDVICAEMVRGTRYVSVKVKRGDEMTSMYYPPPGTYVFRYSLNSAPCDWKKSKAYRFGIGWNNPLLPISVADEITSKSLPPTQSFCSLKQDNLVISALKKADLGPSIMLRAYEIEGSTAKTSVNFLGRQINFNEVNLLEEDIGGSSQKELRAGPYTIKSIKFDK